MQKHYNYLDIDLDSKNYRRLRAMQGDIKSRYILVSLYSNNLAYDLSNCTVKIYGLKRDKTIFFNNTVIKNAKLGQFEIELTNQALAVAGELKIQILILGTSGEKLTSSAFFIDIGESIIDENAIESSNEFNVFVEGLASLAEYDTYKQQVAEHEMKIKDLEQNGTGFDDATIDGYVLSFLSNGSVVKTINLPKEFEATLSARTITPTTTDQVIASKTLITGEQTIKGDSNLVPSNILRGRNNSRNSIFGVYGTLDPAKRIVGYTGNPYYFGLQVADVARSYHLARVSGHASFQYNDMKGLFTGNVTDANGNCLLDCSGFLSLVLRGIDYEHSPFNGATGTANKTFNPPDIAKLCANSEYLWADDYLDKQIDDDFADIGIPNYRSIKRAAQIANYYYSKGCTIYEYSSSPTSVPNDLCPGDLIFWSKSGSTEGQKSRFKAISHVGVVSRNTERFYQVTGSSSSKGDTVFYSYIKDHLTDISLIVRPLYYPIEDTICPLNVNLLPQYYYDDLDISSSTVKSGVTFASLNSGGFSVKGKPTDSVTFYLYNKTNPVTLTPGTYKLSGTPVHPEVSATGTSLKWGIGIKKVSDASGIAWDRGKGETFTISANTQVYVYFYLSSTLTDTSTFKCVPKLVRIS